MLPDAQLQLIDKDLRWVISTPIPISISGFSGIIGVFNLDGLKEVRSKEDLAVLENPSDDLLATAQAIGKLLAKGAISWNKKEKN